MTEIEFSIPGNISRFGAEIGSLYFKAVGLRFDGSVAWTFKRLHGGNPEPVLNLFLREAGNHAIGLSSKTAIPDHDTTFDPVACLHAAVRHCYPDSANILEIGAANLTLLRLDGQGQVLSIQTNSLCAAGTGAFLDAQAIRMGISYDQMNEFKPCVDPPTIATRCAVFAKSDLVYRQQEGFDTNALWSGLCRGMAESLLHTLTKGKPLSGLTVLCGGVALNKTLVWWLDQKLNADSQKVVLEVMPNPEYAVAHGAALSLSPSHRTRPITSSIPGYDKGQKRRPGLELNLSQHNAVQTYKTGTDDDGNDITLHIQPDHFDSGGEVFLGVDIGSTSTKLCLIDSQERLVLDVYRRTEGEPIQATQKLFRAVMNSAQEHNLRLKVKGAATTGSGRNLIGNIIDADLIVNEISAHARGAIKAYPDVETVFEIGGQDAKFISIKDKRIVDANMNYVCAAGTGSFVEELASKLGFSVEELGKAALGTQPPFTSTRCTVFMEQDVFRLLQQGITRSEAAGAVMYSVIENYLEKVVGRRPVNTKRVYFQGATARNPGLIAAIENLLSVEVITSPYCHVMGAFGAALLAKEKMKNRESHFLGLHLGSKNITVTADECGLCSNTCRLYRASIDNEREKRQWGMRCGREANDSQIKIPDGYSLFQKVMHLTECSAPKETALIRKPAIILPKSLTMYSFFPFWKKFFDSLGIETHLSPSVDQKCIETGNACTGSDFCLPAKAAIGQVKIIREDNPSLQIFVPHMLADYEVQGLTHTRFCPYVEILPSLLKTIISENKETESRILAPVIDWRIPDRQNSKILADALRPILSVTRRDVQRALFLAHQARKEYDNKLIKWGESAIRRARQEEKPVIVIIGRPYNTFDSEFNHSIPRHIAECGFEVIPMCCLPKKHDLLKGEFENMFWSCGQHILSALIQVAQTEGLYAVFLSNYGCGPDSFLLTYTEPIMGAKPLLILELDEHGSDGAYQTRVEAFLDVVKTDWATKRKRIENWMPPQEKLTPKNLKKRTIWIPPMHAVGNRIFAATFRSQGYDAQTLPLEDEASFSLGKRWTRGTECLPMALTLGTFLKQISKDKENGRHPEQESALFLPTSDGPCRFGQYRTLNRIVLDQMGLRDLPILSPGAHNAYSGLERELREKLWESILASDILFKMRCKVIPYEVTKGDTEQTLEEKVDEAVESIEQGRMNWNAFLKESMRVFSSIPVTERACPLVGVVGEIYVRCNPFANNRVIQTIEELGGEAWLSPISEWILYTAWMERFLAKKKKSGLTNSLELALKWHFLSQKEHAYYKAVNPMLKNRMEPSIGATIRAAGKLLPQEFEGESILTLGRTLLFGEDGADIVVNCSPFGCMHGNITSTIFEQIKEGIGLPVLNIFYDGIESNTALGVFIQEAARSLNRTRASPRQDQRSIL